MSTPLLVIALLFAGLCAALAIETRRRDDETDGVRGILYGMPVRQHEDGGCTPLGPITGLFLDFACATFGFNGHVYEYEIGDYWGALWCWLTDKEDDGGGPTPSGGAA